MFLIKANTVIQVQVSKSLRNSMDIGWMPYTTKEDKLYDKAEVWDLVAVKNNRYDIPNWAYCNIVDHGYTVIERDGKYAIVRPTDIEYVG